MVHPTQTTPGRTTGGGAGDRALTIAAYLMLLLFGVAQAVLGTFFYSVGPVPLASLGFDVLLLATCLLAAWGLGRPAAAFVPAAGWFMAAFILASGTSGGSVLITASTAGEWFLFGGSASGMLGLVAAFTVAARVGIGGRGRGRVA